MLSTDKAWENFGRDDPYFGVLANEKFSSANIDKNRAEFFASGEAAVSHILDRYETHFGPIRHQRTLDHGCGVGRLTLPLARHFLEVVALDSSSSMLAEAKSNVEDAGLENVRFGIADDRLSSAEGHFDFVNSYMVLQHIRVRRGLRILTELIDKVRPGGGLHVHVSIRTDAINSRALWWASHHIPGVKIWQNIRWRRPWNAPAMQMNNYPLNRVLFLLTSRGVPEFLLATEQHGSFLTCSIICKKPH